MQNASLDKLLKTHDDGLKDYESLLVEQATFLAPLSDQIVARWAELYLSAFGRRSFFSADRVRKIFGELAQIFIHCLKENCLDIYFENLNEKGLMFARLGVPFEEVIISLHLFEESCLEKFLASYPDRSKLPELIIAMEELHNEGLSVLASSYFEETKAQLQKITQSLQEENETLKKELGENREIFFRQTTKDLQSMQLMVSSINHKLRSRVYQFSRLQKISDALENECHIPKLLKVASDQLLAICPANSQVYFGLFDEERKKVNLFYRELPEAPEASVIHTFYFSELTKSFQDALYDETKKFAHFKGYQEMPPVLMNLAVEKSQREFLLIPIRKYSETIGFIFLNTPSESFFSRNNYRFYQRAGQAVSKAIVSADLFERSRRQEEYVLILAELNKRKIAKKSIETTLDFCLSSLMNLLGAERTSVMHYDDLKKELRVCAAKGYKVYPISGTSIKWGEGVAGLALKESKIISIPKMREPAKANLKDRLFTQGEAPEMRVKSLLCLPLLLSNKPLGVVNISTINFHKHFEPSEIDMAHNVVTRMAEIMKDFSSAVDSQIKDF